MKKLFYTLAVLFCCVCEAYAQSSLVATLNSAGNVATYYGPTALQEAMKVARDGDVITLSSGVFAATDITKAITLRGAGMLPQDNTTEPTVISGDFTINIPDESSVKLTMQGIYHNFTMYIAEELTNALFQKCRFQTITPSNDDARMNFLTFVHCRINNHFHLPINSSVTFINSVINDPYSKGETDPTKNSIYEFNNCIIIKGTNFFGHIGVCSVRNSIIHRYLNTWANEPTYFVNGTSATNCLCAGGWNDTRLFSNSFNSSNWIQMDLTKVFKTFTGSLNDDEKFELTDEAKELYKGSDNKEIGLYGGTTPYSEKLVSPRIVNFDIPEKTDATGKLNGITIVVDPGL